MGGIILGWIFKEGDWKTYRINLIQLGEDRDQWRAFINAAYNLQVPQAIELISMYTTSISFPTRL